MAGHGMTLFLDGNETSSIAMAFALYELAAHPQVQQQLRQEIFTAGISTTSGITYDKLHALNYLDMVMNETLRLHPPVQVLTRVATEECCLTTSTGQEFKLRKGMLVTVPVLALHTDPALHNDPTKFLPERFSPEVRKHMDKFSFLPFGEGPRICLGFRFGMTEAKLGVVALLTEFEVRLSPLMLNKEIQLNPMSTFLHTAKNGLWLQFVPLQKNN
ncbi:hypothetical protein AAG570_005643 [Ranatra chinensis]|uniref:Cytochrome P450 n=1 Tax=Ranatra chinensis TaxID=642074 RepID=A0ABD0YAU6_9HEMI